MTDKQKPEPTKGAKIFAAIFTGVILLVIIIGISSMSGNSESGDNQSSAETANVEQPKASLATRVNKQLLNDLGTDSLQSAGKPFEYITGMKDQGDGWVDVSYQTDCDKDTATSVAKQIVGTVELDVDDLQTVNVICTNGTSSYANRDSWAN